MKTLIKLFLYASAIGVLGFGAVEDLRTERIVTQTIEVPLVEPGYDELLETVPPKYGVPSILAHAIVEQESGGKRDAIRFEPGQVERARKVTGSKNESEIRQYASSHCPAQVMGWHAPRYNMSWVDLYVPTNCIEVAMAILSDCLKKQHQASKYDRHRGALACYNGSTVYADQVMARVTRSLYERAL
jgi:hypothetical protein